MTEAEINVRKRTNPCVDDDDIPSEPCTMHCESCSKNVTTNPKIEYNLISVLTICFILFFYGFFLGIPLIILIIPLLKNIIHNCPYCSKKIKAKKLFPITIQYEIVSFQYHNCIIIMKLFYVIVILIAILLLGLYYNTHHDNIFFDMFGLYDSKLNTLLGRYLNDDLTWNSLIKDCGAKIMVENSAKANEIFLRKYYNMEVEWTGLFIDALVVISSLGPTPEHMLNVNVRMIPSESLKEPDLYLSIDDSKYAEYESLLKTVVTGDAIKFKAIFEEIGNEFRPHHLKLIHIEKIADFIPYDEKLMLFQGINFNITGHVSSV